MKTQCHIKSSVKHLFIHCPLYEAHHNKLRIYNNDKKIPFSLKKVSSPKVPVALMIEFLTITDYLKAGERRRVYTSKVSEVSHLPKKT